MSLLSRAGAALWARRMTLLIWAVIAIAVVAGLSYSRANQARTDANLTSPSQDVRDAQVLPLVQGGHLVDALTSTQNPNEDAKSVQNLRSVQIRQNAADSVNRLSASHKITDQQALDTLFLLRKDADQGVKDRATAGLATLGAANDTNLNSIVSKLKDGDPDIRSAAVDALSHKDAGGSLVINPDKTAKLVDPLLKDPSAQDSAQSAMQNIGEPAVPLLLAHLSDPDVTFRQKIVAMLQAIASPQAVPDLVKMANGDEASVRRVALVALASTVLSNYNTTLNATNTARKAATDPKAKPEDVQKAKIAAQKAAANFAQTRPCEPVLIAALRNPEDNSEARTQAALALGRLGSAADVSALVSVLGDFDARVRQASLQGVQSAGTPAVGPLTAVLTHGTLETRAAAAQALGGIGTPPAVTALQGVLASAATPVVVRRSAVIGLGQSGNTAVIPALVASLSDPDGSVASAASDSLLTPSLESDAIPALIASFPKPDPVPFLASQTLSRMGDLPLNALETVAKSSSPQAQTWAAVTLGLTDSKNPTVTAALTPLAHSTTPSVQYAASQALNRLSGV